MATITPTIARVILFVTLVVFALSALASLRTGIAKRLDRDAYFAARNSQSAIALGLSFFASGTGAWVLFSVAEVGTQAGSIGVAGYALSVVVPLVLLMLIAPYMRASLPNGVTFADYVQGVRSAPASRAPARSTSGPLRDAPCLSARLPAS